MEGHADDRKIRKVIKGLKAGGVTLKFLGSYPSAEEIET
jgi:prephenate dehydratase